MKIIYFRSDFVVPILHTTNKGNNQIKLKKESFKTLKGLKMSFQSKQIPVHSTSLHYKWWYMYHIYIYIYIWLPSWRISNEQNGREN